MSLIHQKAPDFTATAVFGRGDFRPLTLSEVNRDRFVVLFFYPLDFSVVCPTEVVAFSKKHEEFRKAGATIIGVSCDSRFAHKAWINHGIGELTYPLVEDLTKDITRSYDALLAEGHPTRATFVIDPHGIVQYASYHNPSVGRSVPEVLRVVQALQSQCMCPADWKPGDATLDRLPKTDG